MENTITSASFVIATGMNLLSLIINALVMTSTKLVSIFMNKSSLEFLNGHSLSQQARCLKILTGLTLLIVVS